MSTIRAYQSEAVFSKKNYKLIDTNQKAYFYNFSTNCWLGVRLEFVGTLIVTSAALLSVLAREYNGYTKDGLSGINHENLSQNIAEQSEYE